MSRLGSLKAAVLGTLRPLVRDLGAELLHRTTLTHPSRVAHDKLTIVTFHRVLPHELLAEYPIPTIAVTPEELDWFLMLFDRYYTVGTLGEVGTRFALGDRVLTRHDAPAGHTRLPRYARGKPGVIVRVHGTFVFPDTNAHGEGEQPHALYSVRFDAGLLWGESAEPRAPVHIDLWERYLLADAPARST